MARRWLRRCLSVFAATGVLGFALLAPASPASAAPWIGLSCYNNGVPSHNFRVCVEGLGWNVQASSFADSNFYRDCYVELWGLDGLGVWKRINSTHDFYCDWAWSSIYDVRNLAALYGMSRFGACLDAYEYRPPPGGAATRVRRCAPSVPYSRWPV
jgi:hypothetical protein